MNKLLERHLYSKLTDKKIRVLDFGCGVGLSTEIVLHHLNTNTQLTVEAVAIDINEANLEIAGKRLPQVKFKCISTEDRLEDIGKFDLIVCNFVLVEMKANQMLNILNLLKTKLTKDGILIVTNPTGKCYRSENQWYTFNNQFPENIPTRKSEICEKMKYHEDQPIKVQVFAARDKKKSFTFFDFFHSGLAYRTAYEAAGFQLLETHKPIGNQDDKIEWKAESTTPPYKIHVLGN